MNYIQCFFISPIGYGLKPTDIEFMKRLSGKGKNWISSKTETNNNFEFFLYIK